MKKQIFDIVEELLKQKQLKFNHMYMDVGEVQKYIWKTYKNNFKKDDFVINCLLVKKYLTGLNENNKKYFKNL
jgi:hypothetical protein